MENLNKFVKRSSDGGIDIDASCAEFRTVLEEYAVLQAADLESVAAAVSAVFTDNPNLKGINLPALASFAATKLNATPGTHQATCERVMDYVRNAKDKYEIAKGRNGGVRVKTETPATV